MGKLINRFGKQGGVVGEKAAAVVALWKTVVEKEVEKARSVNLLFFAKGSSNIILYLF